MKRYAKTVLMLCMPGAACAQDVPAQRYIDAQGVEIIQNRAAPPKHVQINS